VLDVNYVSPEGRLYTDESKERLQKRLMAELGEELTLVADHSKLLGQRLGLLAHEVFALAQFGGKRTVRLVTDAAVSEDQRAGIREVFETALPGAEVTEEDRAGAVVFTARPERRH
jgi:hypothetical protein